jgi:type VI secretion system (T6SS) effector TldE1-like protein
MRVSAGIAAVAMGFAVGLGTQGIGPAYAGLGVVLSGISTVAMPAMRTSDLSEASEPSGSIMPMSRMPASRIPQGMQLASLDSTLIVESTVRQSEISTFAERFLFKQATPEESADANADADAAPAPAAGKTAASPGPRAPAVRSAAKLPPATAAAPVPTPAPAKKIHTADLSQDPNLHVDATNKTAIYDISAHVVYLPNGRRLEAHSGLGPHLDDVRYVNLKARGPTPPNVYQLTMREELFHGVRAIRLNPVDETRMYGRDGILAHTYMLGPKGDSNGCISFADYNAFLNAFQRGEIDHIVVVEHLGNRPDAQTTGDWLSDKVKDIFTRS